MLLILILLGILEEIRKNNCRIFTSRSEKYMTRQFVNFISKFLGGFK